MSEPKRRGRPPKRPATPLEVAEAVREVRETPTGELPATIGVRVVGPGALAAPPDTSVVLRLPPDLHVRVKARAEARGLAINLSLVLDLEVFMELVARGQEDTITRSVLNTAGYQAAQRESGALAHLVKEQVRKVMHFGGES